VYNDIEHFFVGFVFRYKQNKGSTKRNGSKSGTINNEAPHVQVELKIKQKMVTIKVKLTMKHPPRFRYCTKTVLPLVSGLDDNDASDDDNNGFPPNSK
jgi:hypothetical protein